MTTKRGSKKSSRGGKSARAPGRLSALQDDTEEVTFFSSPARSAQSYCCHLGRPRLRVRPRHTFG